MSGAGEQVKAEWPGRNWRRCLAAVFLLALAVRCYAVWAYPAEPVADAADYQRLAAGLVQGLGYVGEGGTPTAWRPPGYPFFLAGVYTLFGVSAAAARAAQAVLGVASVLLLVLFGARVLGRSAAFTAGLLAAVYPGFFWLPRLLLSENLSLFLMLASLCAACALARGGRAAWGALLGVLLGAAVLVRGANLLVAGLLLAGLAVSMWRRGVRRRVLVAAQLLAAAGILLVMAPWVVRNYRVFHRFVPVATQDGMGLYASYWPPRKGDKPVWGSLPGDEDPVVAEAAKAGDEVEVSKYLQRVALGRLRERPSYFFALVPSKLISAAAPFDWEIFPHAAGESRSFNLAYVLVLVPALLGLVSALRRGADGTWLLWVLPLAVLLQSVLFYGSPRFRLPAESTALLLAGAGLGQVWAFLKGRAGLL